MEYTPPNSEQAFELENGYYLTCEPQRFGKALAQYELFKQAHEVAGEIVECGLLKGASFCRFALLRALYGLASHKRLIGFDIFGAFPEAGIEEEREHRDRFVESSGGWSISEQALQELMDRRGIGDNVELVKGDVTKTIPEYVERHPNLRIGLLNIDTDLYEPAKTILEHLYPRVVKGGVVLVDNYGVFPGETQAVDEYFPDGVAMLKHPLSNTPSYFIKP